jgi:hypothetical protein
MKTPQIYAEDKIELCDGHSDYGHSVLYCEQGGNRKEIYRTRYETNRMNEVTSGIVSFDLQRAGNEWILAVRLVTGEDRLCSTDGWAWH